MLQQPQIVHFSSHVSSFVPISLIPEIFTSGSCDKTSWMNSKAPSNCICFSGIPASQNHPTINSQHSKQLQKCIVHPCDYAPPLLLFLTHCHAMRSSIYTIQSPDSISWPGSLHSNIELKPSFWSDSYVLLILISSSIFGDEIKVFVS